jgi:hypothetical protein
MSQRVSLWGSGVAAVVLALLPGCGPGEDELAMMAARLKGDAPARWGGPTDKAKVPRKEGTEPGSGPPLDHRFWTDQMRTQQTTVRQALIDLGARLEDGKVVAPDGREVYFLRVKEYNRPRDADRWEEKTAERLERYHIVRMYQGNRPKD